MLAHSDTSYRPVSVCVYVCLSQVGVLLKWLDGSSWFLARRHTVAFYNYQYRYLYRYSYRYLQFVAIAFYCIYIRMNFLHSCV